VSIDRVLFNLLNTIALRWGPVDTIVRVLMNDYVLTTALALVLFGLWFSGNAEGREAHQKALFQSVAAVGLGNGVVKALNLVYYRNRPFAFEPVRLLFYRPSDSSFPSNATLVGFALATVVWYADRRAGRLMYVMAGTLALTRVIGGVHFPADILAGALMGVCAAYVVVRKLGFLDRVWLIVIRLARRLLLA
jgi:undecaprenyl-diphosphatase